MAILQSKLAGLIRPSRRVLRTAAVLLVLVGGVVWWGSNRVPAVNSKPLLTAGCAKRNALPGRRFRVGVFNIHGGRGRDRVRDIGRVADCLRDADLDVVGLCEVHGHWRRSPGNQAEELGDLLGMAAVFAPTEQRYWHDHFGNGLLTRVKLDGVHRIPLTCTQGKKYRNAVLTHFRVGGTTVHFLTVHIDRVQDRKRQLRSVFALFQSLQTPAVLVGDLNTFDDDPLLQELMASCGAENALLTCRNDWPELRVDWILTRGLTVVNSGCEEHGASDHPLMWAELELPQSADPDTVRTVEQVSSAVAKENRKR